MITDNEVLEELKEINRRLGKMNSTGRMVGREFLSGFFHSLGYTIATSLVIFISIYYLSKINLGEKINSYVQKMIPKTQFSVPYVVPSLGQP